MNKDQESMNEFKRRIIKIKSVVENGINNPTEAPQRVCQALSLIADAVIHFVEEAEDEKDEKDEKD